MTCRDWEEQIALHAGGDRAPEEAAAVESHLAGCAQCRETAAAYGWSLDLLRDAHREPIAPAHYAAVRARVLAKLHEARQPVWRRPWAWVFAATVAAALAAALLITPGGRPRIANVRPPASVTPPAPQLPAMRVPIARVARARSHRRKARPKENEQPSEQLLVKLYTDDPNVIIYWIADRKGE